MNRAEKLLEKGMPEKILNDILNWYYKIEAHILYFEMNQEIKPETSTVIRNIQSDFDETRKKIENMSKLAKIDFVNMKNVFKEIGLEYNIEKRIYEILFEDVVLNARISKLEKDNEVIAYFEYIMLGDSLYIVELQILKEHRNRIINEKMIKVIIDAMKREQPKNIYALRQKNNKMVEKLYSRLGLETVCQFNDYDLFLKTQYEKMLFGLEKSLGGK